MRLLYSLYDVKRVRDKQWPIWKAGGQYIITLALYFGVNPM